MKRQSWILEEVEDEFFDILHKFGVDPQWTGGSRDAGAGTEHLWEYEPSPALEQELAFHELVEECGDGDR